MQDSPPAAEPPRRSPAPGDRAPPFDARTPANPRYRFDTAAGRWLVLCFARSLADPARAAAVARAMAATDVFDDRHAALFVVSNDPGDEAQGRIVQAIPGRRVMWDFDGRVARLYGIAGGAGGAADGARWVVIDPGLVVRRVLPFRDGGTEVGELLAYLRAAPPAGRHLGCEVPAPVLILPDVFEPALCRQLIGLYEAAGGTASGFMRDVGGRTVAVMDPGFKSRRDHVIADREVIATIQARFRRRVLPEIARVHFFRATRMERYVVSCYDAAEGGHFSPHRDNTTRATAHRRFAASINLNDGFEGGEVVFPEYGPGSYKAPPGGAVIFSCALLHAVTTVTAGRRYAFLPFLYDEAAAAIRERNAGALDVADVPGKGAIDQPAG